MWTGIILVAVGLYFLCLSESLHLQRGDLIILCATLFFALHIQLVSKFVHQVNGLHMMCLEFFCADIFCSIITFLFESPSLAQIYPCIGGILFAGILDIGVCYALQVTAQKYTDPTVSALLMSLESVFSALAGVLFLHESFTLREGIGVVLICFAVIAAQLPSPEESS